MSWSEIELLPFFLLVAGSWTCSNLLIWFSLLILVPVGNCRDVASECSLSSAVGVVITGLLLGAWHVHVGCQQCWHQRIPWATTYLTWQQALKAANNILRGTDPFLINRLPMWCHRLLLFSKVMVPSERFFHKWVKAGYLFYQQLLWSQKSSGYPTCVEPLSLVMMMMMMMNCCDVTELWSRLEVQKTRTNMTVPQTLCHLGPTPRPGTVKKKKGGKNHLSIRGGGGGGGAGSSLRGRSCSGMDPRKT